MISTLCEHDNTPQLAISHGKIQEEVLNEQPGFGVLSFL